MDAAKLEYENSRRKEFRELLAELASSQDYLKDKSARIATYKRLEALYYSPNEDECYRHLYSDIFVVLTQVVTKDLEGDINILGQNILCIYKGYHPKNYNSKGQLIDISENVRKLYDHTSLDIARLNYSEGRYRNLVGEEDIADLRARSGLIEDQLAHAEKKLIVAEDKVSSLQKEYISTSIIGIGLNVNQIFFNNLPNVSSLQKITGKTFDLNEVLTIILNEIKKTFDNLTEKTYPNIFNEYHSHLFRINKPSTFELPDKQKIIGYIRGVSEKGELQVEEEDNIIKKYRLKEIKLLY